MLAFADCTGKNACDKALQAAGEELSGWARRMMSVVDVEMHSRPLEQSRSRNLAEAPLVADSQSDSLDKPVVVGQSSEDGLGESSTADYNCNCNCSHFGLLRSSRGIHCGKNRKPAMTAGRIGWHNWKMKPHAVEVVASEGDRWVVHQRGSCMKQVDFVADSEGSRNLMIVWMQAERRTQTAVDNAGLG